MKLKNIYHILVALFLSACGPAVLTGPTPTPVSSLPDLAITTMYVSMVDNSGRCLDSYQLLTVLVNQSTVPANDVFLIETSTGHQVQVGTLGAFQSISLNTPATSPSGSYSVIVDPQNVVIESDENNNTAAFFESTATPPASCPPLQAGDATPTPLPPPTPAPQVLDGLIYANSDLAQIFRIASGGQAVNVLQGISARFSPDGILALIESSGDILLAEPMDNPGINITNTEDRLEFSPQWLTLNSMRVVFNSMEVNEAQEKDWDHNILGYLTMMNMDGTEYTVLADIPSYTVPSLSSDGRTIAYEESGAPMLYEIDKGSRPFDPTLYGYQPGAETIFTSPSFSNFGRYLTWWTSENSSRPDKHFSLVVFDLQTNTSSILHTYTPLSGTSGWLPNPVWNGNEGWLAYQTRGEVTDWDLWISQPDGNEAYRLGLATNPVWSPDQQHLAYVQSQPRTSNLAPSLFTIDAPSRNVQQANLPGGSIPLAWLSPAFLNSSYFPMFTAPGDWPTYSNPNPPYQIQYPPNATLESFPEKLTINLPMQPGSQMTEKSITIETHMDTIDACYVFSPWEGKTLLNGLDLKYYGGKYWETGSDGGRFLLGNYASYKNGVCYTIQLRMTALADSAAAPTLSREDMDSEVLLNIISTLRTY
jgi:hypothetical protein